jgi:hypothetical protein
MAVAPIELLQHVSILAVEVADGAIRVDLYGGDESACGTVVYRFDDPAELASHARTLRQWHQAGTDVTYLKRGEVVVLMDEVAYLADVYAR